MENFIKMIFTPILTVKFKDTLPQPQNLLHNEVNLTDPNPWLDILGLHKFKNQGDKKSMYCLYAWILPGGKLPIHRDTWSDGTQIPWSLVFCPDGNEDLVIEIYEKLADGKVQGFKSPSGYTLYKLPLDSAKKIDEWPMTKGSVMFNPGQHWHSVYNPSNKIMLILSIRDNSMVTGKIIESIFKK